MTLFFNAVGYYIEGYAGLGFMVLVAIYYPLTKRAGVAFGRRWVERRR
jgi:hypothetical protein